MSYNLTPGLKGICAIMLLILFFLVTNELGWGHLTILINKK